jgi:hypothetical protein
MKNIIFDRKSDKKTALIVGIVCFLGFCFFLFLPSMYNNPFSSILIYGVIFSAPIGILEASVIGWAAYLIFKRIKKKATYIITLIILIIIGYAIGFFSWFALFRAITYTKPYTNKIDSNHDGKIDKWIYQEGTNAVVTLDTDYDGMPDEKEYYKNGDLIKKEKLSRQ